MSINLPSTDSPIRNLIDVASVVEILAPAHRSNLPTLRQALDSAKRFFDATPASKELHVICWRCDGRIVLERIGRKGGHNIVWTFGQ